MLQDEYNVHFQSVRELYIRIDWLNWDEHKVDELQGNLIGGNISIDRASPIRRTCNLDFIITNNSFIPAPSSHIWLNRKFKLFIGIRNIITSNIIWFDKGLYILNQPSLTYSYSENSMRLQGLDKMCLYDGTLGGELYYSIIIDLNTDVNLAMRELLGTIGGETKFNMDLVNKQTPYTIELNFGDHIYKGIRELADLYMSWSEIHFDINGYFIFEKEKNRNNDPIIWNFQESSNLILSYNNQPDFQNIKNHIVIRGHFRDDGIQISAEVENINPLHPFSIPNIGKKSFTLTHDMLFEEPQAIDRAEWELNKRSNLKEIVEITCVPIYMLDVNRIIYFNEPSIGLEGKHLIDRLNIPLSINENMSITSHKMYE